MKRGIQFQIHPPASPYIADRWSAFLVAASTIIMAYAPIFGPLSILVFYAMWLPLFQRRGVSTIRFRRNTALSLLFAAWCCMTVLWSAYQSKSLYNSLEYVSLIACALIMAERVRMRAFLKGIIYGSVVTLLASLASGRYGVDPFSGKSSLVGLFGSKNVVGLFAQILILSSLIIFPSTKGIIGRIALCVLPGTLGAVCLTLSKSATSVLSTAGTLGILLVLFGVTRMPKNARWITFVMATTWLAGIVAAGLALDWDKEILRAFGKSSTLTGRTLLWDKGIEFGMKSPILGHGFSAFWVQGHLPAEHLWYKFGIYRRAGFHFHNLFIQSFVDLGFIGAGLLILLLTTTLMKGISRTLRNGMQIEYVACVTFTVMFAIRAFTEVDIVGTYGIGTMLFFSLPPRLSESRKPNSIDNFVKS